MFIKDQNCVDGEERRVERGERREGEREGGRGRDIYIYIRGEYIDRGAIETER